MTAKSLAFLFVAALSSSGSAQTWSRAYERGLQEARAGRWAEAREAFQQAVAARPEDQSAPTVLPGPSTERKLWRDGAAYSPNFLAAYSLYRQALKTADPIDSTNQLKTAAGEFETLVAKKQFSEEAFFFLDVIYTRLGDATKRQVTSDLLAKQKTDFKIDREPIAPEEIAAIGARTSGTPVVQGNPTGGPVVTPGAPFGSGPTVSVNDSVAPLNDKFALVVGQGESHLSGGLVPFANTDAESVRDALVNFAGYPAANVQLLQNVTAAQIMAAAKAIAAKTDDKSTILIYYAGAGINLGGKDYLAGKDTESGSDIASMVALSDLLGTFARSGARVFAFYEVNRTMDAKHGYFGKEVANIGSLAQVQSTRPGDTVRATYRNNQAIGIFTNAFVLSLANIRSNRIPIFAFTNLIVDAMRRGTTGLYGGGNTQTCTLPQLTNLAIDAKF